MKSRLLEPGTQEWAEARASEINECDDGAGFSYYWITSGDTGDLDSCEKFTPKLVLRLVESLQELDSDGEWRILPNPVDGDCDGDWINDACARI